MKPTRTDNNKPSQSTPIRKGKLSSEEIKKTAQELTKGQLTTTGSAIKTYKTIVETKAPKIEPVATPGNYKVYAEALKAMIKEHDTVEVTADKLHEIFPQARCGGEVALQLKRSHGLSYRRVENGRNDTYVFFVEPTREELIVQLTSAESKVIELDNKYNELYKAHDDLDKRHIETQNERFTLKEENSQLKSDLKIQKITSGQALVGGLLLGGLLVYLYLHINGL